MQYWLRWLLVKPNEPIQSLYLTTVGAQHTATLAVNTIVSVVVASVPLKCDIDVWLARFPWCNHHKDATVHRSLRAVRCSCSAVRCPSFVALADHPKSGGQKRPRIVQGGASEPRL